MDRRRAAGALLALTACIACSTAAPTLNEHTALDLYEGTSAGCYYNFQHYGEGDRIMTNEPCLNCTCHNRMLMCYLRVCPFTKPIGQDCTVEKRADQCCPIVTCPDVPVDLLTSTPTTSPAEYGATGVGKLDKYGCSINGRYFPEGSKVPPIPSKPCEHCYCIRNMTTCVMQECTLHVDGCTPIYHKDVCCPVRYSCDHPEDEILLLDDMTTTVRPTPGFLLTTTTSSPITQMSQDCVHDDKIFADGALIKTEKACEHCYCMKGDIVCVVQECGTPMENEGKNCTSQPPREGQCCPDTYICAGDEIATETNELFTTELIHEELTTLTPPRRHNIEGSGYRKEPDNISFTDMPLPESHHEGSGYGHKIETPHDSKDTIATTESYEHLTVYTTLIEGEKPEKEITLEQTTAQHLEDNEKATTAAMKDEPPINTIEDMHKTVDKAQESVPNISELPLSVETESVTKINEKDSSYETTQKEVFSIEENISTPATETIKHDIGISTEENDLKISSSPIFEESDGITTESDKGQELDSDALGENGSPQVDEYSSSTPSTPFLEEVEQVTTETQSHGIVTDSISEKETLTPHKHLETTMDLPDEKPTIQSESHSSDHTMLDTDSHEYIPIVTAAPTSHDIEKSTLSQEDAITDDFTKGEIKETHSVVASVTTPILESNEYITTEANKDSSVVHDILDDLSSHHDVPSTENIVRDYEKATTKILQHDITDIFKKDDTYQHTSTTPSSITLTSSDILITTNVVTEGDKSETYSQSTTISTPYIDHKETTVKDFGSNIFENIPNEGNKLSEEGVLTTVGYDTFESNKEVSTELNKFETSSVKNEGEDSYDSSKLSSTDIFAVDEDDITTTELPGKDQEISSHNTLESETTPNKNVPSASSTPFLEEIEKSSPEISEDNSISSTTDESEIHMPEKYIPNISTVLPSLDKMITTQGESTKLDTSMQPNENQIYDKISETTINILTTKEDLFTFTTEPSFKKDDIKVQTTSELYQDVTLLNTEITSTSSPAAVPHEIPPSVMPEYTSESEHPYPSRESNITTENIVDKNINTGFSYQPALISTTFGLDKIDLPETTSFNPVDNEINEDIPSLPGRIPGEGDCLFNGITYKNKSSLPSANKCESNCKCLSSIVKCDPIICSPPPEYMKNCQPTYDSPDSCCPTYVCDQVRETLPPLPYKQITTPETPKEEHTIECHDDECKLNINSIQTTEPSELCNSGKCEQPGMQIQTLESCEGNNCKSTSETHPSKLKPVDKTQDDSAICNEQTSCKENQDSILKECTDDLCRRKETTDIEQKPLCLGLDCKDYVNLTNEPHKDVQIITDAPTTEISADSSSTTETTIVQKTDEVKNIMTSQPDTYVTKDQDYITNKDNINIGESHSLETKPEMEGAQKTQTDQPSFIVTDDMNAVTSESDVTKYQTSLSEYSSPEIDKETTLHDYTGSTSFGTTTGLSAKDEIITEKLQLTSEHEATTQILGGYFVTDIKPDEAETESPVPSDVSDIELSTIAEELTPKVTTSSTYLIEQTENNLEVTTQTDHLIPSLGDSVFERTTKTEIENDNNYSTTIENLGIVREKESTTLPDEKVEITTHKFETSTQSHIAPSETTESDLTDKEIISLKPISTKEETVYSEEPISYESSTFISVPKDDEMKTTLPVTLAGGEKIINEVPDSFVTESEPHELEETNTLSAKDITEDKNIASEPSVILSTETNLIKDYSEETKLDLPMSSIDENKKNNDFEVETDELRTTPPISYVGEDLKIKTELPSIHVTEPAPSSNEMVDTKTTSSTFKDEDEKTEQEYTYSHVTEAKEIVTETAERLATTSYYTSGHEYTITEIPLAQITKKEADTTGIDESRISLPPHVTEEKKEEKITTIFVTELPPHKQETTEINIIEPVALNEEHNHEIDIPSSQEPQEHISQVGEEKTTLPTFISSHQTVGDDVSIFTIDETKTTLETFISQDDNKKQELSTFSPSYQKEVEISVTKTPISDETASSDYTNEIGERLSTHVPMYVTAQDDIDSQTLSPHVTDSRTYATDIDEIKTTITTDSLDDVKSVDNATPHYQEPEIHTISTEDETITKIPITSTKADEIKKDYTLTHVTESITIVPDIDEYKTTLTHSITQEDKIQADISTPVTTQSVSSDSKIPIHSAEEKDHTADGGLQKQELDELQTTQPTTIPKEESSQPDTTPSTITETSIHEDKLDDTKTTQTSFDSKKEMVENDKPSSQVTESTGFTAQYLSEDEKVGTVFTVSHTTDSVSHLTNIDHAKTTIPDSIQEQANIGSEAPHSNAIESEAFSTVSDLTSLSYTSTSEGKNIETQTTTAPITESEAQITTLHDTKTTVVSFMSSSENIYTDTSATESVNLLHEVTTAKSKVFTPDEQTYTGTQIDTTTSSNLLDFLPDTQGPKDVKEQESIQLTTELYESDAFDHIEPETATNGPLTEETPKIKETDKVISAEDKLSTEIPEVETATNIYGSEISETKAPDTNFSNEIHYDLHVTEVQQLPTDLELTTPQEEDDLPNQETPESLTDKTIIVMTQTDNINTTPTTEEVQKSVTESLYVPHIAVHQEATTEVSDFATTDSGELVFQEHVYKTTHAPHIYEHITESASPVIPLEEHTIGQENDYETTLMPESLTTNVHNISQTSQENHILEEEPIEPSTTKPDTHIEITSKSPEDYVTIKQETKQTDYDSPPISPEIVTKKPYYSEMSSFSPIATTIHTENIQTTIPVSEKIETLPDFIELEEHTHKTLSETTGVPVTELTTVAHTISEMINLDHSSGQTTLTSDESLINNETSKTNKDITTPTYLVEKSTETATPLDKISTAVQNIDTKPITSEQFGTSTILPTQMLDKVHSEELTSTTAKPTPLTIDKESSMPVSEIPVPEKKPSFTSEHELPKPVEPSAIQPSEEIPTPEEEGHFPPSGSTGYGGEPDYVEEDQAFAPGTCRYGGKVYVSAQQIPRDDPCDFCFCFRSDIICLQQSCPPPIHGCHEEPIQGFCCPRYECPVSMATTLNVTTTTTTTTTTLPPHFPTHSYKGAAQRRGCQIKGHSYKVGEVVRASSGPCLHCTCGGDGQMKCDPKVCTPEPMLRQMIAAAVSAKRRR